MQKLNILETSLNNGSPIYKPIVPRTLERGWLFSPDEKENETTILIYFEKLAERAYSTKEWVYTHKNGAIQKFPQNWEFPPSPESRIKYDYYLLDNDEELTLIKIKYGFIG